MQYENLFYRSWNKFQESVQRKEIKQPTIKRLRCVKGKYKEKRAR